MSLCVVNCPICSTEDGYDPQDSTKVLMVCGNCQLAFYDPDYGWYVNVNYLIHVQKQVESVYPEEVRKLSNLFNKSRN